MKRLLSLMALCCFLFVACGNDENEVNRKPASNTTGFDEITLSQTTIEVGFEPDTYAVNVTSSYSWDATTESDWITLDTTSGAAGDEELKFTVKSNEDLDVREGVVELQNSEVGLYAELSIVQKAFEPTLTIDIESLTFLAAGGEQSVKVVANFAHEATTESDWLNISESEEGYTISASTYLEVEERTAEVVISNERYNVSKSISISQSAFEPILNVEDISVLEFGYMGGEQSISVESNFEYDIAADVDWVILSKTETGVVVEVLANTSDYRTANVTISSKKYNISGKVIKITQQERELEQDFKFDAVDLGLSVKWANCNIGASRPEEYGDYFAWGEINTKNSFRDSNSLTWGKPMEDIEGNAQYDAATATLGDGWRMPTQNEMKDLMTNCTWQWTTLNNVNGCRVTGPNGNSIFLPAAGYRSGEQSWSVGSQGAYWSSCPSKGSCDNNAYVIHFESGVYIGRWLYRVYGLTIRAVSE